MYEMHTEYIRLKRFNMILKATHVSMLVDLQARTGLTATGVFLAGLLNYHRQEFPEHYRPSAPSTPSAQELRAKQKRDAQGDVRMGNERYTVIDGKTYVYHATEQGELAWGHYQGEPREDLGRVPRGRVEAWMAETGPPTDEHLADFQLLVPPTQKDDPQ